MNRRDLIRAVWSVAASGIIVPKVMPLLGERIYRPLTPVVRSSFLYRAFLGQLDYPSLNYDSVKVALFSSDIPVPPGQQTTEIHAFFTPDQIQASGLNIGDEVVAGIDFVSTKDSLLKDVNIRRLASYPVIITGGSIAVHSEGIIE